MNMNRSIKGKWDDITLQQPHCHNIEYRSMVLFDEKSFTPSLVVILAHNKPI